MNREEAFIARWAEDKAAYQAWGDFVSDQIVRSLAARIDPIPTSYFLKISVIPRVKSDLKLVEKAFYRPGKSYDDPYAAITDKVGTRFVVLLGRDISTVASVLEEADLWTHSLDRDYEKEQSENPIVFDYAAVHYVVRAVRDFEVASGVTVRKGTPCEVQIKTILQHAYSELTHDTIYKPQIRATPAMRRDAAKAMALLEATNDYFEKVESQVSAALSAVTAITADLSRIYKDVTGLDASPSLLEGLLLEAYQPSYGPETGDSVRTMLAEKPFLVGQIKERLARRNPLFAQPSILLAYLDIFRRGRRALQSWPLTPDEMEPLLTVFGESRH